ncbi:Outer membrane receptor proteins, mostly Fe transport [Tangfeifania diversioriginum]|uniref:Outer membrane receptor proteins, mostly Fe transport n=1 Tax=Tangfeifania diversioriginum TaxID=1168035 RepID=A0A1M6MUG1_9BACT|nr:outer membrane beta-barrel family protein [Tangfeifania diversioriginum]SHJ87040.1 Outer membrane receptor proteins, mostly Fe transport [Tangfeifania diversioriginum]
MKKLIALTFIIFSLSFITKAENDDPPPGTDDDRRSSRISGVVIHEETNDPLEFANIAVYSKTDSSLVSGGITNENGEFEISDLDQGEFYLEAQFIGFEKSKVTEIVIDENNKSVDLGRIEVRPSSVAIGDVDVVADKAPVEFKLDKKVVNVSQDISAIGGTAVDVLENTPSVQVDIEGNVSVRGSSNFTVLIDGRPSVLSGSEALRQIPSSAIESIEIITNPSAKYEPDGMAGIINLVMKKNSMNGFSGIVNASVGTGDKYRGDFTLNYRTEKMRLFVGADWRDENRYGEMTSIRETYLADTTSFLEMNGASDRIRRGHNFKSGIEWFMSDKTTLSLSGELGKSVGVRTGDGDTYAYTEPASEEVFSVTEETSTRENDFHSVNLNFQHNFNTEGHKLEAMAFYSGEKGDDEEKEDEILADSNYQKTDEYLDRVFSLETEEENEFRLKADYTYPFSENGRFEAGMLSRMDKETEGLSFKSFDQETDSWIENEEFSSTTDFRRDIHALYSTFSNSLGNLQYMLGLRGEYTIREILNTNATEASELNRFDLFPTLHLSYNIKETNELMASYSRRIDRPGGRSLDPNPSYYNRYTIRFGNPDLEPEYTDSYELGALKRFGRSYIALDAFHRVTNNKIEGYQEMGDDGIFYLYTDNFNKDYSTGLEISGNINFTEWLLVNASVSMFKYRITGDLNGEDIDRESNNWNSRMNTTLKFASNSRMQINAYYRGPSVSVQGESESMFFTNVSYRHEFFDRKLSATLSVRDPLGTARFKRISYSDDFRNSFEWKREPRVVMLTLSYRINNFKSDERGDRNGGGGMDFGGGGEY